MRNTDSKKKSLEDNKRYKKLKKTNTSNYKARKKNSSRNRTDRRWNITSRWRKAMIN